MHSRVARPPQWGGVGGPGGSPGARLRNCPEEEKEGKEEGKGKDEGKEDKEGKKQRGRRERVEGRREDRRTNKLRKQSKNKKS